MKVRYTYIQHIAFFTWQALADCSKILNDYPAPDFEKLVQSYSIVLKEFNKVITKRTGEKSRFR